MGQQRQRGFRRRSVGASGLCPCRQTIVCCPLTGVESCFDKGSDTSSSPCPRTSRRRGGVSVVPRRMALYALPVNRTRADAATRGCIGGDLSPSNPCGMAQTSPALRRLQRASERVTEAEKRLQAAREAYYLELQKAIDAGETISSIARFFGVSRQAVQKTLKRSSS